MRTLEGLDLTFGLLLGAALLSAAFRDASHIDADASGRDRIRVDRPFSREGLEAIQGMRDVGVDAGRIPARSPG